MLIRAKEAYQAWHKYLVNLNRLDRYTCGCHWHPAKLYAICRPFSLKAMLIALCILFRANRSIAYGADLFDFFIKDSSHLQSVPCKLSHILLREFDDMKP